MRFGDALFGSIQQFLLTAGVKHDISETLVNGDTVHHVHTPWHTELLQRSAAVSTAAKPLGGAAVMPSALPVELGMRIRAHHARLPHGKSALMLEEICRKVVVYSIAFDTGAVDDEWYWEYIPVKSGSAMHRQLLHNRSADLQRQLVHSRARVAHVRGDSESAHGGSHEFGLAQAVANSQRTGFF